MPRSPEWRGFCPRLCSFFSESSFGGRCWRVNACLSSCCACAWPPGVSPNGPVCLCAQSTEILLKSMFLNPGPLAVRHVAVPAAPAAADGHGRIGAAGAVRARDQLRVPSPAGTFLRCCPARRRHWRALSLMGIRRPSTFASSSSSRCRIPRPCPWTARSTGPQATSRYAPFRV